MAKGAPAFLSSGTGTPHIAGTLCRMLIQRSKLIHIFRIFEKLDIMETYSIEILNSKAKSLLKKLADLDLIRVKKGQVKPEFQE